MSSKRIFVFGAVCAFASGALFAQDFAITGADFESGKADAKLAEIARQAAASGKTVVVTTPPYWQARAAGKIRAAAPGVTVKTSDAFFENVLVRIVDADKSAKPEAVAAKPVEAPAKQAAQPKPAPREETKVAAAPAAEAIKKEPEVAAKPEPARVAIAKPATPPPAPAPKPEPVETAHAAQASASAPPARPLVPAGEVASIAHKPSVPAANAKPVGADTAAIKHAFENQFNLGQPAIGEIRPGLLQKGDEIFVREPVLAVVRRDRSRVQLFWVAGELNLDRAELVKTDVNRYRVNEPVRDVANPSLRAMHSEPKMFAANIPTAKTRTDMERHFNDAKVIASSMRAEELRYGDLFYIYRSHAVVFRRTDLGFDRYWLEGPIDLNQAGLIKDGDAYRIVGEKL